MTAAGERLRAEPEPQPPKLDMTVLRWIAAIVLLYAADRVIFTTF